MGAGLKDAVLLQVEPHVDQKAQALCIVQADDRNLDDFPVLRRFTELNKQWCNGRSKLGKPCVYSLTNPRNVDVPPLWYKVWATHESLNRPLCSTVLWLDTDAVLRDRLWDPRDVMEQLDADMIGSPDRPPWTAPFCAGVFAVRNTARGRQIIQEWWDAYLSNSSAWSRSADGSWLCDGSNLRELSLAGASHRCQWANGIANDQGAAEKIGVHKMPGFKLVDWRMIQSESESAKVNHFAGGDWKASDANKIDFKEKGPIFRKACSWNFL